MNRNASFQAIIVLFVLLMLPGCGNNAALTKNDLKQAGTAYHIYHDNHQRGPANWEELTTGGLSTEAAARLQKEGYEFKWGVAFKDLKEGTSFTVMAESKTSVYKLMMDGSVAQ